MPRVLTHKKFQAGIGTSLVIFLGQFFPALAEGRPVVAALASIDWWQVAAPMMTAIGAQGFADFGKERSK